MQSKSFSKKSGDRHPCHFRLRGPTSPGERPEETAWHTYLMVSALIEHIVTGKAPLPRGHYAQATRANGLVFVSGQLPLAADGEVTLAEGLEAQVRQALSNVREILLAAGSDVGELLSVQIFVADIETWPRVNEIYREFVGDPAPARTVVPCGRLHYGAQVEISAIALCGDAP